MCSRRTGAALEPASQLAELRCQIEAEAARKVAAEAEAERIRMTMVSACMMGNQGALGVLLRVHSRFIEGASGVQSGCIEMP